MFRKFKRTRAGDYMRVPQLWSLILQSRIIITCGPTPLPETLAGGVEFVAEDFLLADGPSVVRVTDFYQQVVYLPLGQCRTYLALRQSIEQKCLEDVEQDANDYTIHVGENETELDASQWPGLLQVKGCAFIYVRLIRRPTQNQSTRGNDIITLGVPVLPKLIDYGDLDSYQGASDDERIGPVLSHNR
jgi:hypothetical protein